MFQNGFFMAKILRGVIKNVSKLLLLNALSNFAQCIE
jgi:hypothetical protein